ncbi:DUF4268 domain-containing protein [Blastopirellula marina]|uniref:DUF4268 domain-containing protein n=1 Tax=Blastopirellula marina TaxID=124 RepID=A0A2S8FM89_9BACT|nr:MULTISPECIES: DUF4268 domain-containing protein [Pirellulaceae]PQO33286.1 DUF4268 domain-containing protein [Blastopirellula marina]RCS52375.1 DUF4268 domain-containing protein [Bremerella cremea]
MPIKHPLGRLEPVQLREAWLSEAGDFTPWLAEEENIQLLGETIGIELEVEAQEKSVGPFRADILCKDTANDQWVLIENQLERTDHTHLGQLITYAAGLNSVTIVWISQRFTEEHRAALDWLNKVTSEEIRFFGLQVELWRIGQSAIAPKFNVISSPNDWTKSVSRGAKAAQEQSMTPAKERQVEFWTGFVEYVEEHGASFKTTKPLPQHWMNISVGRSGFKLNAIVSHYDSAAQSYEKHELRAELELTDEYAKIYFAQLEAMRDKLEAEVGEKLLWYNPENRQTCRAYLRTTVDLNDNARWLEYFEWLRVKLDRLHQVFFPKVKLLQTTLPPELAEAPTTDPDSLPT